MVARTPFCQFCGHDTREDQKRIVVYLDEGKRDEKNRKRKWIGYVCEKCAIERARIDIP